ncbi:MAG: NAD-dependent epimerase [Lysobacterales bacterium]|jgi:UDP-glucuronate 4-epimerase|nr:MAG: NAD-dependent epimerase [Xanthomonadales bacterium]
MAGSEFWRGRRVLVTGHAGFIGAHLSRRLLELGAELIGFDNLNPYYDPKLKRARLRWIAEAGAFTHLQADLTDREAVAAAFAEHRPEIVFHLAAQAGVRYAAENPEAYVQSNVVGSLHVLEGCRRHPVRHLLLASTSSVYGANRCLPFREDQGTDHPLTLYAASKKGCEAMAHAYAHLFGIPVTVLRFFTVYGPWGRPDMALFRFAEAILDGRPVPLYNHGRHRRSFTYVDDVIAALLALAPLSPRPDPDWDPRRPDPKSSGVAPYRLLNLGNARAVELTRYLELLEAALGRKAQRELLPAQPGDVEETEADASALAALIGFRPETPVEEGVRRFAQWYLDWRAGMAA